MPEPLKNIYSPLFFEQFTAEIKEVLPKFNKQAFINQVFDVHWQNKELKQRMRHISTVLKDYLPGIYPQQIKTILLFIDQLQRKGIKSGFEYMFLPDFIEQYGLENFTASLNAMEQITKFTSCEFAIRPFLLHHQKEVMQQMLKWSKHAHHHVRRFSSEGCRPRLPWAMAIPSLKEDPSPIIPVLENLRNDESLFVRKSVANNLNDIAKDHPDVVAQLVKSWKGESKGTDWIIKHGCRTLLRKADNTIYGLFGLSNETSWEIQKLTLNTTRLTMGESLSFSFELVLRSKKEEKLRIEYAIYYVKANGSLSRKVFHLAAKTYQPNTVYHIKKQQRFQDFTTRKHYPGKHKIGILINGKEMAVKEFVLIDKKLSPI